MATAVERYLKNFQENWPGQGDPEKFEGLFPAPCAHVENDRTFTINIWTVRVPPTRLAQAGLQSLPGSGR